MRRLLAASVILVALSSTLTLAQQAPISPAPAPPADTQPGDGTLSDSHIAAAVDLLKANHTETTIQAMLDVVMPLAAKQAKRAQPNLSDAEMTVILQKFRSAITARQDELLRIYAIEYARHFSEQELHGLTTFYSSDLGQKYVGLIPTLLKETSPLMERWMSGVVQQVLQDIQRSLPSSQNDKP